MRSVCTLALVAIGASASASEQPRVAISAGAAVRAGDRVTIRVDGLPIAVDEFEFVLVSDALAQPVRLTHELPGSTRSFEWRVPSLPAGTGRIVLRMSVGGQELEVATSNPFAIEASTSRAPQFTFRDGEWWAIANDSHGEEAAAPGDRVSSAPARSIAALPTTRDHFAVPRSTTPVSETLHDSHDRPVSKPARSSAPLTTPQRK